MTRNISKYTDGSKNTQLDFVYAYGVYLQLVLPSILSIVTSFIGSDPWSNAILPLIPVNDTFDIQDIMISFISESSYVNSSSFFG